MLFRSAIVKDRRILLKKKKSVSHTTANPITQMYIRLIAELAGHDDFFFARCIVYLGLLGQALEAG